MTVHVITPPLPRAGLASFPVDVKLDAARLDMINTLVGERPHLIRHNIDEDDVEARMMHVQAVLNAVSFYVAEVIADTADNAPCGTINRKKLIDVLSDARGEIIGALANAAEDLRDGGRFS